MNHAASTLILHTIVQFEAECIVEIDIAFPVEVSHSLLNPLLEQTFFLAQLAVVVLEDCGYLEQEAAEVGVC